MEKRILIVEDEDYNYNGMEETIQREATARDINITLVRATSYVGAKRVFREAQFAAVSFDMVIPLHEGEHGTINAGAELILYYQPRFSSPYLLFSGSEVEKSRKTLQEVGVDWDVLVLKKDPVYGYGEWARKLLDLAT
jgi:hypothetical protein